MTLHWSVGIFKVHTWLSPLLSPRIGYAKESLPSQKAFLRCKNIIIYRKKCLNKQYNIIIRNGIGIIFNYPMNTKRKIKEYCQQLYTQKFDKLDEMNQFLERCKLSKFTQGEIDNLSIKD